MIEEYLFFWEERERKELEDLMSEPPGGHNHGRKKNDGQWFPLEALEIHEHGDAFPVEEQSASIKRYVDRPRTHGTAYTYRKIGCRCGLCRDWKAQSRKGGDPL